MWQLLAERHGLPVNMQEFFCHLKSSYSAEDVTGKKGRHVPGQCRACPGSSGQLQSNVWLTSGNGSNDTLDITDHFILG